MPAAAVWALLIWLAFYLIPGSLGQVAIVSDEQGFLAALRTQAVTRMQLQASISLTADIWKTVQPIWINRSLTISDSQVQTASPFTNENPPFPFQPVMLDLGFVARKLLLGTSGASPGSSNIGSVASLPSSAVGINNAQLCMQQAQPPVTLIFRSLRMLQHIDDGTYDLTLLAGAAPCSIVRFESIVHQRDYSPPLSRLESELAKYAQATGQSPPALQKAPACVATGQCFAGSLFFSNLTLQNAVEGGVSSLEPSYTTAMQGSWEVSQAYVSSACLDLHTAAYCVSTARAAQQSAGAVDQALAEQRARTEAEQRKVRGHVRFELEATSSAWAVARN